VKNDWSVFGDVQKKSRIDVHVGRAGVGQAGTNYRAFVEHTFINDGDPRRRSTTAINDGDQRRGLTTGINDGD